MLFLVNPKSFLPLLDYPTYLNILGLTSIPQRVSWEKYSSAIEQIQARFPGCEFWEIELFARQQRSETVGGQNLIVQPDRCWTVTTNASWNSEVKDHWSEFRDNYWVRTADKDTYRVDKPGTGDILLAHYGGEGRGIGVVQRNDYTGGWTPEGRIHALWLNKRPSELSGETKIQAFGHASPHEMRAFRESSTYTSTWMIIDPTMTATAEVRDPTRLKYEDELRVWLRDERTPSLARNSIDARVSQLRRIQRREGDLDGHFGEDGLSGLLARFEYTKEDADLGKEAKHGIPIDGSTYEGTQSLKSALGIYQAFRKSRLPGEPAPPSPLSRVDHPRNQILYGPPGTGKTYETLSQAVGIVDGLEVTSVRKDREGARQRFRELRFKVPRAPEGAPKGQIAMVTFHQNYAYEDFVEGIRPRLVDGPPRKESTPRGSSELAYELRSGIFHAICKAAEEARSKTASHRGEALRFVLIIDEINRGNIAKIFGELITLIEPSRRLGNDDETTVTLPYSGDDFGVPDNLYIIGTMNTADRSIQQLDTALRRRFTFVEMMPDPDHSLIPDDVAGVNCRKMLRAMNERIALLMDREHQIGHTYLLEVESIEDLADRFRNRIFPLLQEYFYDDWRRIDAVLGGNAFVQKDKARDGHSKQLIEKFDLLDEDRVIHERLPDNDPAWKRAEEYQRIYEPKSG